MSKSSKSQWPWPSSATHSVIKKNKGLAVDSWSVTLEEDANSGELIMPLPDDLLAKMGWIEGDALEWDVDEKTGKITLRKH